MIEILKVFEKYKIYQLKIKAPMEVWGWTFDKKICTDGQDLPDFEDLSQGSQGW